MAIAKAAPATFENEPEEFLLEFPPFCEKCLAVENEEKVMIQSDDGDFTISRT